MTDGRRPARRPGVVLLILASPGVAEVTARWPRPAWKSPTHSAAASSRSPSRRSRSAAARPTICGWPGARCRATTRRSSTRTTSSSSATATRGTAPTSTASRSPRRALVHGDRIRLGRSGGAEMVFLIAESEPVPERSSTTTAIGDLRQITALLEGLRALGSGRVLDDVLSLVLDSAIDVSGAERGFIMLASADRTTSSSRWRAAAAAPRCRAAASRPAARFPRRCSAPASRASSPTCSTATWRTCTWARSHSASATSCACRCSSCATSTRRKRSARSAGSACCISTAAKKGC